MTNTNQAVEKILSPGTPVVLKLTGEKLLILHDLDLFDDDPEFEKVGYKYLTRTIDHKKKVVFSCEIQDAGDKPYHVKK